MTIQSHFKSKITSPIISLGCAYLVAGTIGIILYFMGVYQNSYFFKWGPPVPFFMYEVKSKSEFYGLLTMVFIHQLINNWVSEVTYPWIINQVQDYKTRKLQYGKKTSLLLINLHALYSELDLILILTGVISQISFFMIIVIADLISASVINWQYIKKKDDEEMSPLLEIV